MRCLLVVVVVAGVALAESRAKHTHTHTRTHTHTHEDDGVVAKWKDPSLPIDVRVADLVSRLSDEELFSQLSNSQGPFLDQPGYEWGQECLSGFQTKMWATLDTNFTSFPTSAFPQAVTLGMSFDTDMLRSVGAAIASEVRAGFVHLGRKSLTCNSPVLNVARDPRWGRCMESYGEDPTLISKLGSAYITGMQRGDLDAEETDYLLVAASPKHFADYNLECTCFPGNSHCNPLAPKQGCIEPWGTQRNYFDANVSAHDMRETYLAGFKAGAKVGMQGVMCSINSVNGIPMCGHRELLTTVLKTEFNMSGAVISDGDTVEHMFDTHHYASSSEEAAADGLKAGCDMSWDENLPSNLRYGDPMNGTAKRAVQMNLTSMESVKKAVSNTLYPRFRVGVYDPPDLNPWNKIPASIILSQAHVNLAVRAAVEGTTLLKNNINTLPIASIANGGPRVIGVAGAAANNSFLQMDRYTGEPDSQHIVTIVQGIESRAKKAGSSVVTCHNWQTPAECSQTFKDAGVTHAILAITGNPEGEQHDRATIGLESTQLELVKVMGTVLEGLHVRKTAVVVSGGAVSTEQIESIVDATIWMGKGGMQAGTAIASLLYGDEDFSGRVGATIYKEGWVNYSNFLDSSISGGKQPRGYRYNTRQDLVLYPFGHGLSYSSYSVTWKGKYYSIAASELQVGKSVSLTASITTLNRMGSTKYPILRSVLLFLHGPAGPRNGTSGSLPVRIKWLGDFTKARSTGSDNMDVISLEFTLGLDALGRWLPLHSSQKSSFTDGMYLAEKGAYTLSLTDCVETAVLNVT